MSAPDFNVLSPTSSSPNNAIFDDPEGGSGNNAICLVGGTVDPGDCHNLVAIYVYNTTSQLSGTDEEKAQTVRDAGLIVTNINMNASPPWNWTADGEVGGTRGMTNNFYAVADFEGTSSSDPDCQDPVTILKNSSWGIPDPVNPCPARAPGNGNSPLAEENKNAKSERMKPSTAVAEVEKKEHCSECKKAKTQRTSVLLTPVRVVDVLPLGLDETGRFLKYWLFDSNGLDGNRLMKLDDLGNSIPLRASSLNVVAKQVQWRPSQSTTRIVRSPRGLPESPIPRSELGPGGNRNVAMRFCGRNYRYSLVLAQKRPSQIGLVTQVITSQSEAAPQSVTVDRGADLLIQHNSNIFNIYGNTFRGVIEVWVEVAGE